MQVVDGLSVYSTRNDFKAGGISYHGGPLLSYRPVLSTFHVYFSLSSPQCMVPIKPISAIEIHLLAASGWQGKNRAALPILKNSGLSTECFHRTEFFIISTQLVLYGGVLKIYILWIVSMHWMFILIKSNDLGMQCNEKQQSFCPGLSNHFTGCHVTHESCFGCQLESRGDEEFIRRNRAVPLTGSWASGYI